MFRTTPGLDFLARLLLPALLVFLGLLLAQYAFKVQLSTWILPCLAALAPLLNAALWAVFRRRVLLKVAMQSASRSPGRKEEGHILRFLPGLSTLRRRTVGVRYPHHVKSLLKDYPESCIEDENSRQATSFLLRSGFFNSSGEVWQYHRSITRPFFRKYRAAYLKLLQRNAACFAAGIKSKKEAGSIDTQGLLYNSILSSTLDLLLGRAVSQPTISKTELADAFIRLQDVLEDRERLGWTWPLHEVLVDKTQEPMSIINRSLNAMIRTEISRKISSNLGASYDEKTGSLHENNLLQELIGLTSDSRLIISLLLSTALTALRADMANSITNLLKFVSQNSIIHSRINEEILSSPLLVTDEGITNLQYLKATISETLRVSSPARYITWTNPVTIYLPSIDADTRDSRIPYGTKISFDVSSLNTSKDLWGFDADQFTPSRFLGDRRKAYPAANPEVFLPLDEATNMIFGEDFTYDMISTFVVELLRQAPALRS